MFAEVNIYIYVCLCMQASKHIIMCFCCVQKKKEKMFMPVRWWNLCSIYAMVCLSAALFCHHLCDPILTTHSTTSIRIIIIQDLKQFTVFIFTLPDQKKKKTKNLLLKPTILCITKFMNEFFFVSSMKFSFLRTHMHVLYSYTRCVIVDIVINFSTNVQSLVVLFLLLLLFLHLTCNP